MIRLTYEWEHDYITAILETDNAKSPERIVQAEATILTTYELLRMDGGGTPQEQTSLFGALAGLDKLRAERLGGSK